MSARMIVPLLFGLLGAAVLVWLGLWQLDRLAEKEAQAAEISARIASTPVPVPAMPDPVADRYLPVTADGRFTGKMLRVLVSQKEIGAGYRIIAVFETGGRRFMVDRGFVGVDAPQAALAAKAATVTGNLHWPDEVDSFTPSPDLAKGLWFARDVPAMAQALATEPVLLVAASDTGDGVAPLPVDAIPAHNHFSYAVQWFGLAVVWLGMTVLYLWRIRRRTV